MKTIFAYRGIVGGSVRLHRVLLVGYFPNEILPELAPQVEANSNFGPDLILLQLLS